MTDRKTTSFITLFLMQLFILNIRPNAQSLPLTPKAIEEWPMLSSEQIDFNGNFISYLMRAGTASKLYIKSCSTNWLMEIDNGNNLSFTQNESIAIYQKPNDTLCILNLKNFKVNTLTDITTYKITSTNKNDLLISLTKSNRLSITSLSTGEENHFEDVASINISPNGKYLILKKTKMKSISSYETHILQIATLESKKIWDESIESKFFFEKNGNSIAFWSTERKKYSNRRGIWLYNIKEKASAIRYIGNPFTEMNDENIDTSNIGRNISLNIFDSKICYSLAPSAEKKDLKKSELLIWNTKDLYLKTQKPINKTHPIKGIIDINTLINTRLAESSEIVIYPSDLDISKYSYIIKLKEIGLEKDVITHTSRKQLVYLISLKDGQSELIRSNDTNWIRKATITPDNKYVIYFDPSLNNYIAYNIPQKRNTNITKNINDSWIQYSTVDMISPEKKAIVGDICGFYKNLILISAQNNIWLVDPEGEKHPINITKEANKRGMKTFFPLYNYKEVPIISDTVLFSSFDRVTKKISFHSFILGNKILFKTLNTGNYIFGENYSPYKNITFITSGNKKTNLLYRQNAQEYPNLFTTEDFSIFRQQTFIYPEKKFKWYTNELISWHVTGNIISRGILYKPSNFDSTKKYPLIIFFYEKMSDNLNKYLQPKLNGANLEITSLTSNGYLVFTPDIIFTHKKPGESFLTSVISATRVLIKKKFIATNKIGLQGHSYGSYGVNYIITHTNKFAAAYSGSGSSNLTSQYTSIRGESGGSKMDELENGQYRLKSSLWESRNTYITNSPIFFCDKVKTPILLMSNKEDGAVPYEQGLAFFLSLRRLGKPAWLLQYDGENHFLVKKKNMIDFQEKVLEFFDYYLKKGKKPVWMSADTD